MVALASLCGDPTPPPSPPLATQLCPATPTPTPHPLPFPLSELTSFLRKANRQLRQAALSALEALIARDGSRVDTSVLQVGGGGGVCVLGWGGGIGGGR